MTEFEKQLSELIEKAKTDPIAKTLLDIMSSEEMEIEVREWIKENDDN